MGEPAKRRATYDDLCALPENVIGEIIDGELFATPRPAPEHSAAASVLGAEIVPPYHFGRGGGPGGWILLFEPEVSLGARGELLVPDFAGWRRERFQRAREHNWIDVVPDWVCEVLSPGTAKKDRHVKMGIYRESAELRHLWLVDPLNKTLEAFGRDEGGGWVTLSFFAGDDEVCADPFPAARFPLKGLWLEP